MYTCALIRPFPPLLRVLTVVTFLSCCERIRVMASGPGHITKVCIAFGLSPRCRGDKNSKSYLLFEALFQSQLKGIVTFTTHQKPWAAPHEISRRARVEGAGSRDNHAHGASMRRQGARTGKNVRLPSARRPCDSRVHNDSRRVSGTTALASTEAARWQRTSLRTALWQVVLKRMS